MQSNYLQASYIMTEEVLAVDVHMLNTAHSFAQL